MCDDLDAVRTAIDFGEFLIPLARTRIQVALARTQLRSIFGELLTRVPDIEVEEPDPLASAFIRGVKRMECSFTPHGA